MLLTFDNEMAWDLDLLMSQITFDLISNVPSMLDPFIYLNEINGWPIGMLIRFVGWHVVIGSLWRYNWMKQGYLDGLLLCNRICHRLLLNWPIFLNGFTRLFGCPSSVVKYIGRKTENNILMENRLQVNPI